jgi:hypothetical protein
MSLLVDFGRLFLGVLIKMQFACLIYLVLNIFGEKISIYALS